MRPKAGGAGVGFAELIGGKRFDLKLDPKAPLKDPASYTMSASRCRGPTCRPSAPGSHIYMQDFSRARHAARPRDPAAGDRRHARLGRRGVDQATSRRAGGARSRISSPSSPSDEWTAVRAARALQGAVERVVAACPRRTSLSRPLRADPGITDETLVNKGERRRARVRKARRRCRPATTGRCRATPRSARPARSPTCAPTARRCGPPRRARTAFATTFARFLGLPREKVRLIYLDGSGCYGMNGHEDAAADAAILSRAVGRPVRVQWIARGRARLGSEGAAAAARHLRRGRRRRPHRRLAHRDVAAAGDARAAEHSAARRPTRPASSRRARPQPGLISQNGDPPYAADRIQVVVHWLKDAPLRPSPIRSPGKVANCFAVESFVDELAAAARLDPVEFRLRGLTDPRGIEVIRRAAALMGWQPRPSPRPRNDGGDRRGRGISYVHYKHNETYVAIGMEVAVERATGAIRVERVVCAHDCGLIINPDGVRAQVEGNILQTLSRALHRGGRSSTARASTSVDWASYPILRFSEVPKLEIELIERPNEPPLGAGEAACGAGRRRARQRGVRRGRRAAAHRAVHFLSRSRSPELVEPDDILEYDLDSEPM